MKKTLLLVGVGLMVAGLTAAAVDLLPSGNYFSPGGGVAARATAIHLTGWTYDPDTPTVSSNVVIYINGDKTTGTLLTTLATNVLRTDVNTQFNITGNHGFDYIIPTGYYDDLPHVVYMYGVDTSNPALLMQLVNSPKTINSAQ